MSKSLLLLTLVVAQLLAGSGGAVYLCPDCGSLLSAETPERQAPEVQPSCRCCSETKPVTQPAQIAAAMLASTDDHSPIPLLLQQSPSRVRDEAAGESQFDRELSAPLHLSAAATCSGHGFTRPRAPRLSAAASQLTLWATVCLRC